MARSLTILGSTGSIGASALDVARGHTDEYSIFALTARSSVDVLLRQCFEFSPRYAVLNTAADAERLRVLLSEARSETEVLAGDEALRQVAADKRSEVVLAAIVGAAGLMPSMAAVGAGKRVLLANKEALVMAGHLFMDAVQVAGAELLPVDSEHNAIFQCLQCLPSGRQQDRLKAVRRLILTASGGPFYDRDQSGLGKVTPEEACAHPNWNMGRKISVDSATLMNKGLEKIEASWLFDLPPERIDILIHRQSVIHSMVEFIDGALLAQLGPSDMRVPLAYALAYPERTSSGAQPLDFSTLSALSFDHPDNLLAPCLGLAADAYRQGQSAVIALNAANEVAVEAFLQRRLSFTAIPDLISETLEFFQFPPAPAAIEDVIACDQEARSFALQRAKRMQKTA